MTPPPPRLLVPFGGQKRFANAFWRPKGTNKLGWVAVVGVVVVAVTGACTPGKVAPLPPPPKVAVTTTTVAVDYGAIGLPGIPGRTTSTVLMGPGKATISGSVRGPDGPVGGAVVHAERLVGEGMASTDLVTGDDGRFELPTVLGGRYRVRAWKAAPDNLSLVEPEVFFLEGSERKDLPLALTRYQGAAVTAAIAPDPPLLGTPLNLVVQVVNREVDANGIVRSTPVPSVSVELFGAGDWQLQSANPTAADGSGRAHWQLQCRRVGNQPLSVVVASTTTFNLNLPACTVPPPTGDETDPSATSTTAAPTPASTTTTSTTAKPPATTTTTTRATTTTR
jgi:hypothetical protein